MGGDAYSYVRGLQLFRTAYAVTDPVNLECGGTQGHPQSVVVQPTAKPDRWSFGPPPTNVWYCQNSSGSTFGVATGIGPLEKKGPTTFGPCPTGPPLPGGQVCVVIG